ncbi:MAG: MBL fold metallo-hydrolase [Pirellulaceae bacterium]
MRVLQYPVLVLSVTLLLNLPVVEAGSEDGQLDIYWIDVEGGAATLIVTPGGESILVDTGNPGLRDPNRIIQVVTREAKLRRIDHLVITHYHRDHYGGAETLSRQIPIGTVWDNGKFEGMPDDPGEAYFNFTSEKRRVINPGDVLPLKSGRRVPLKVSYLGCRKQFIAPPRRAASNELICATGQDKDRDGSDNANSVVTLVELGPFRFYDGGDLTWNQEARLVCPVNLVGKVDVYQITHHGLASSNNLLVLRSLMPQVVIMNNGVTKGCMPEVFANLKATPSLKALYQVHKNMRPDGSVNNVPDEFIANRKEQCDANFIKLSVAADGKSYEVSIPAHGHKARYDTVEK